MHLFGLLTFTDLVSTAGYSAVFVLCFLQSCCVPTSSELTMGFAGALAAQGKLNLGGVILVGALGEVVGAYVAWAVGRYAGRRAVDRFGRYVLLTHADLDRVEAWYGRHERFGVFGSRLLPVIRNFVALPAGIAEVPLVRFGILTGAGSLLWDGAWAGIGYGVGSHWHAIASGFGDIGYVLALAAVGTVAFAVLHRYRSYKDATSGNQPAPSREGSPRSSTLIASWSERAPASHVSDEASAGPVRFLASSSGRSSTLAPPAARATGTHGQHVAPPERAPRRAPRRAPAHLAPGARTSRSHQRLASSSGRPVTALRHSDFPNSPLAAWEAVVVRGTQEPEVSSEPLAGDEGEDAGVEANGRLTAMTGALLLVLLAIEGATLLHILPLLTLHVVIGMVLVPVILLKVGSTTWRFVRYYLGSPQYRRKGPPPALLRLLGPFVVVSTIAVVGSGIALLLAPSSLRNDLLFLHKASFVLWFAGMVVHVLGHLLDIAQLAPRDFYRRTRRQIRGAGVRQWAIVSAVCIGILLAALTAPKVGPWLTGYQSAHTTVKAGTTATSGPSH